MSEQLTVYTYNVLFGDAILVEVPDSGQRRFVLVDVGNVLAGSGGKTEPLLAAVDDIIDRTGGRIDLFIMTHEHLDHVQGLRYAADRGRTLHIDTVWMTASSEPGYYDRFPEARRRRLDLLHAVEAFDAILGADALPAGLELMHALNALKTADYVDYIRRLTPQPHYVHRETDTSALHPFAETEIRILAPEEDTSTYYGRVRAHLELKDSPPSTRRASTSGRSSRPASDAGAPLPPTGINASAFYDLLESVNGGLAESLLAIDRAGNNTSLVVEVTWRGRRLLLGGDAEQESWRLMARHADLRPVDLFKVAHHGSRTGRPPEEALDRILPEARQDEAVAILSTHSGSQWKGVPDADALAELQARTKKLYRTEDVPEGTPVVVSLEAAP
jgi:beta-lactamase superfamily II metal-dependent hydrolase